MTKEEKATLIGLVLGDGHLVCSKYKNCNSFHQEFSLIHSIKQREYLEWKVNLIHSILGGNKPSVIEFNNNGYKGVKAMKSHRYFRVLHKYLYKNGIKTIPLKALKRLTPLAIAIWWMDDGSLCKKTRNGKVHSWDLYLNTYLSKEENQVIIDYFQDKWDVKWNLNLSKGKYRLRCSTKEGRKFLNIVRPIVSQVKCMQYKCLEI